MTLGDRLVVMKDGVIRQEGSPIEIYEAPADAFVAGFIGTPAMNLLDGEVRFDGSAATFVAGAAAANTPSSRAFSIALPPRLAEIARRAAKDGNSLAVTLGVRPDAVRPAPDGAPDAASGTGTPAFHDHGATDRGLCHIEPIDVQLVVVFGVGNGTFENFQNLARDPATRKLKFRQGLPAIHAANAFRDEVQLLRAGAKMLGKCHRLVVGIRAFCCTLAHNQLLFAFLSAP